MNKLNLAMQAERQGNLDEAKALSLDYIKENPADSNGHFLLGVVWLKQQQPGKAIECLEQADKIAPDNPQILNFLGVCHRHIQDNEQSLHYFKKAYEIQGDAPELLRNILFTLNDMARSEEAKTLIEEKIGKEPENTALLELQAALAQHKKDYETAIRAYSKVCQLQPSRFDAIHNLGVLRRLNGEPELALEQYDLLLSQNIASFQLEHNVANAYADLEQHDKAITHYNKALNLNESYIETHKSLNNLLWETGNKEQFLKSFETALSHNPLNSELRFTYVSALLKNDQIETATNVLLTADDSIKDFSDYYMLLSKCYYNQDRKAESLQLLQQGSQMKDVNATLRLEYSIQLLEVRKAELAIEQLTKMLDVQPHDQVALAYLGTAWRIIGDPREPQLNDYQNLVQEYTLTSVGDYQDMGKYLAELYQYLSTLHDKVDYEVDLTLRKGTQTKGLLFNDPHPLIQSLASEFKRCIEDYRQRNLKLLGNKYGLKKVNHFDFSGSWSIKLTKNGFHTRHVHPKGWLSSCFYVQLPQSVEESSDKQGWIKFGEPNLDNVEGLPAARYVKPVAGKLVLFPSYMWHGTVPFQDDSTRTTIAFDVNAS